MSRVTILRDFNASPDHNHTFQYKQGEVYESGSSLMPPKFVEMLLTAYIPGVGEVAGFVTNEEVKNRVSEPCIKVEEKSLSDDAKKAQTAAHVKLYGSEHYRPQDF
jgi:hypothetical protein